MGCFDTINFRCPECGEKVEYQSKAGYCNMDELEEYEVPLEIAAEADGERVRCKSCDETFTARKLLDIK